MQVGKCPKCEKSIGQLVVVPFEAKDGASKTLHSAAYKCPLCNTIISVCPDPYALVNAIKQAISAGS